MLSLVRMYLVPKQGGGGGRPLHSSFRTLFHQHVKRCPSAFSHHHHHHHCNGRTVTSAKKLYYSTSTQLLQQQQPIRILYASQTGTAQLFAMQLQEEIEDLELDGDIDVSLSAFNEQSATEVIQSNDDDGGGVQEQQQRPFHIFFSSVTGVGEPPENGKEFYDYIMKEENAKLSNLDYTVFGLGNEKAHPNNYNVIAKGLDKRLEELGANRVFPLGLGDDGDCLEDDYDQWLDELLTFIKTKQQAGGEDTTAAPASSAPAGVVEEEEPVAAAAATTAKGLEQDPSLRISCSCAISSDGTRMISKKYPTLKLKKNQSDEVVCDDLFHLQETPQHFYQQNTAKLHILKNKILSPNAGEQALNEMTISIKDYYLDDGSDDSLDYTTGDHFVVYPRNSHCIVDAYCRLLDVDPHSIVTGQDGGDDTTKKYPLPTGLTVYETLSHCIDLGAIPSPPLARHILGRKQLNYKDEIAIPRRTIVDLMMESGTRLSLEDLLYQTTPMKPRFYSIASSSLANKNEIKITFRPVKYLTSRGILREGVATAYLSRKGAVGGGGGGSTDNTNVHDDDDDDDLYGQVAAYVNSNPTFRLPSDPAAPIMMIAGGCGVAPIRAFIEERIALMNQDSSKKFGPGLLYLGFRNPKDAVYRGLIQQAIDCGALSDAKMSFDHGCTEPSQICMRVTDLIRAEGQIVWDHIDKNGGYIYMCGGARTFGAAVEKEMLEIIQEFGNMTFEEAKDYLRKVHESGRLMEDLAD